MMPQHRLGRRLDDEQQPHRLVNLDHLPRQAGAQVAGGAVHHAQQRRDVVRQLRAAAPAGRVDVRKVVLQVDAAADRDDGLQNARQDRAVGVVLGRVVRGEERAAVEEQPASPLAPADDADGVGGVAALRPHLGQVLRAALDVLPRRREGQRQRGRLEPAAALVGVALAALARRSPRTRSKSAWCDARQAVQVGIRHGVVAGVVQAADEHRVGGNRQAALASSSRTRGSFSICAMARAFGPPAPPPQAPQSYADSCGLFRLVEPWPMIATSRAKPLVSPMSRSSRSAQFVISSMEKPI